MSCEESQSRKLALERFQTSFSNLVTDFQKEIQELRTKIQDVMEENAGLKVEIAEYKKDWVPNNVALWKQSMNQLEKESKNHEFTVKQLQKAMEEVQVWKEKYNQLMKKEKETSHKEEDCSKTPESVEAKCVSIEATTQSSMKKEETINKETIVTGKYEKAVEEVAMPLLASEKVKEEQLTESGKEEKVDEELKKQVEETTPTYKPITIKGKEYLFGVEDNFVYEVEEGGVPGKKKYVKEGGKYKKV
jgi:hypothetical protein